MITVPGHCIFCGSDHVVPLFAVKDIYGKSRDLYLCNECRTRFYLPQPTGEELEIAYGEDYYGASETKFRWSLVEKVVDHYRCGRARLICKWSGGKGNILDVGCGNGRVLHHLHQMGDFRLFGTEMPGNSAERAKQYKEIHLFTGAFADADFQPDTFDVISLFHVYEHLPDPSAALEKMDRLLKPGGILILSFPNIESLQARVLGPHWLHLDPPRHLFFPDPSRLTAELRKKGFRLVNRKYFSPEQNPAGAVQGLLNLWSGKRDLLFERMKGNRSYLAGTKGITLFLHKVFFLVAMPWFMAGDVLESLAGKGATLQLIFKKDQHHGME